MVFGGLLPIGVIIYLFTTASVAFPLMEKVYIDSIMPKLQACLFAVFGIEFANR